LSSSRWTGKGKGESICPPCCGEQRENTIDCPSSCTYLIAARRYEAEHKKPLEELPFPDVRLEDDFLAEQQGFIGTLVAAIANVAKTQSRLTDPELLLALERLARTQQTLSSGLYYEEPLDNIRAREVYTGLQAAMESYQREHQKKVGASLRPGDILKVLVFLVRLGKVQTNGRPLSRAYLDFLRAQLPTQAREAPRLIVPGA
jgi:hypothetical protein